MYGESMGGLWGVYGDLWADYECRIISLGYVNRYGHVYVCVNECNHVCTCCACLLLCVIVFFFDEICCFPYGRQANKHSMWSASDAAAPQRHAHPMWRMTSNNAPHKLALANHQKMQTNAINREEGSHLHEY